MARMARWQLSWRGTLLCPNLFTLYLFDLRSLLADVPDDEQRHRLSVWRFAVYDRDGDPLVPADAKKVEELERRFFAEQQVTSPGGWSSLSKRSDPADRTTEPWQSASRGTHQRRPHNNEQANKEGGQGGSPYCVDKRVSCEKVSSQKRSPRVPDRATTAVATAANGPAPKAPEHPLQ